MFISSGIGRRFGRSLKYAGLPGGKGRGGLVKPMRRLAICGAVCWACASVPAETRVWQGTDGDWNNAANWSPAGVPAANDTASFAADATISSDWTLPGNLTISVAKGATLDLTGVIAGAADAQLTLTSADTDGSGTVKFRASNTFAGNLSIEKGLVYGFGENPFGTATDDTPMVLLTANNKFVKLYLDGVTTLKRIRHVCNDSAVGYSSTLIFDGANTIGRYETSSTTRTNVRSGRVVVTRGIANGGIWLPYIAATASLVVSNTPTANLQYYGEGGPGPIVFACAGNKFTSGHQIPMPYRCDVNGAFDPSADLAWGSDNASSEVLLDLNGTTQTVRRLYSKKVYAKNGTVASAEPGLVTVTDTVDFTNRMAFTGMASLELALAEGKTATLYGQSTSAGDLILSSGRAEIADGGCWSGAIHVKTGTALRLASSGGQGDGTASIFLEGGSIELPEGTMIVRRLVAADGTVYTSGYFAATAKTGVTALPGLAGEGVVLVRSDEAVVLTDWTWTGAAGDTKVSTPGNWVDADGVAGTAEHGPDLTSDGNRFHFPAAATVTVDVPVFAGGLFFDGAGEGTVTIETTDDACPLTLFGGTFAVTNDATGGQKAVVVNAPFCYAQTVDARVQTATTLEFRGALSTVGTGHFVKRDMGEVFVQGDAGRILGSFVNSNGLLRVMGQDPFGPRCTVYNYQKDADPNTRIVLTNAQITGAVVNHAYGTVGNGQTCLAGADNTTNVVWGAFTNKNGHFRFSAGANAELTLAGGVMPGALLIPQGSDWSVTRIGTTPMSVSNTFYQDHNKWCICALAVAGNKFWPNMLITSTLRTEVDNAVVDTMRFQFAKDRGRVDLWGTTQRVDNAYLEVVSVDETSGAVTKLASELSASSGGGRAGSCAGTIKSDRPGAYIAFAGATTYPRTPVFGGAVSFERGGTGTNVIYEANAATGEVFVTGGMLRFAAPGATWTYKDVEQTYGSTGGTWAGPRATVTGGTLALDHGAVFPKDADFRLGGGELALAAGVVQRANALWFRGDDGEWVKQKSGIWGARDNADVSADRRTPLITGAGVLSVKSVGSVVLFR
ncbi:MAG: hypothetical protein ACI4Q3_09625 [Kiritimatiellia bacterium]